MAAKLISTTYDIENARVFAKVRLTVQGIDSQFDVEIPEADLIANAAQDSRDDWKTLDCVQLATTISGVDITLPEEN
jgi:hypothetical protein